MSNFYGVLRRVLLVEDDAMLCESTARSLRTAGWEVVARHSGGAALAAVAQAGFDLVLLDVGLPDMDGFAVCRRLRDDGGPPVVLLTARDEVADRVKGLGLGAQDYIVKPFAVAELIARCEAVLRRGRIRAGQNLRAGALRLDLAARRAWCGEQPLSLTPNEWAALEYLLPRLDRVVTRDELQAATSAEASALAGNALEALVSRLRAKLRGTRLAVRPVRGIGYMLELEAEAEPGAGG